MAQTYTLEAQARTVTGKKVGALRRSGIVPAIIYGVKTEPVPIQIPYRALQSTLAKAGGTSLIEVMLENGKPYSVLAREVQRDIIRGDILHVDFIAVDTNVEIEVEAAIALINEAPAEKASLGIVLQGMNTIRISALPRDLVDHIDVDLSSLENVGDTIFVRDLKISDRIRIVTDPDEMVAKIVVTGAAASEAAAQEEATSAEPEVIGKGKKDEEVIED